MVLRYEGHLHLPTFIYTGPALNQKALRGRGRGRPRPRGEMFDLFYYSKALLCHCR